MWQPLLVLLATSEGLRRDARPQAGQMLKGVVDGEIEYIFDQGSDTSAYAYSGDSHPTPAGNQKATDEFVPLLEYYVERWLAE
jgi:hypothetical protein